MSVWYDVNIVAIVIAQGQQTVAKDPCGVGIARLGCPLQQIPDFLPTLAFSAQPGQSAFMFCTVRASTGKKKTIAIKASRMAKLETKQRFHLAMGTGTKRTSQYYLL
nr:hypothetical protein [uncultured Cohaesibacter sp.]